MNKIAAIYRENEAIFAVNGVPYIIDYDDDQYEYLAEAAANNDAETFVRLVSVAEKADDMFQSLAEDGIEYDEDTETYTYLGTDLPISLTKYLSASLDAGTQEPVVRFIQRLFENPNFDTRMRLFAFMERNQLPIEPDGRFLAYKVVSSNYYDKHTGRVRHQVGDSPRLPWSEVDTDPDKTCSRGLHACSNAYLASFYHDGDRVITVSIAPEDVGSIPTDYDGAKLRGRGYTVIADITDQYVREREKINIKSEEGINVRSTNDDLFQAWIRRYW